MTTAKRRRSKPAEVILRRGQALSPSEASAIAADRRVAVVALIGPAASGKTTLIVGCFQHFLKATPPTLWFRGSDTLMAFEELCHPWQLSSGREEPASIRTELDSGGLLHLQLRDRKSHRQSDLLLADISGEWFDRVRHGIDDLASLGFLERADHLAFCLDGERLANEAERHVVVGEVRDLIRVWVQSAWLKTARTITIILTKWDAVASSPGGTHAGDVALDALAAFAKSHGVEVSISRTAFRSTEDGRIAPGFGVAELLAGWAQDLPPWGEIGVAPKSPDPMRAIDYLDDAGR